MRCISVPTMGFKGGDNSLQQIGKGTTHTHADQGSFVLDMAGARWAEDLGADSYSDYGYFSLQKFDWYAASTAGHNTLSFSGQGQDACMDSFPALLPSGWLRGELTPIKTDSTHCRAALAAFNATAGWGIIDSVTCCAKCNVCAALLISTNVATIGAALEKPACCTTPWSRN